MFTQVVQVRDAWVARRQIIFADAVLLAGHLYPESKYQLGEIEKELSQLAVIRVSLFRDIFFLAWLTALSVSLLDVVEGKSAAWNPSILDQGLGMIRALRLFKSNGAIEEPIGWAGGCVPVEGVFYAPTDKTDRQRLTASNTRMADRSSIIKLPRWNHIKILNRETAIIHQAEFDYNIGWEFDLDENRWIASLKEAFELLSFHRPSLELVDAFASYIVPLGSRSATQNISFSARKFPNVIFKNDELAPHLFAETLVHECDHQFYYALEETNPFWEDNAAFSAAQYYSPWRDDPRPLDGILRGLSAFTRVSDFYAGILHHLPTSEIDNIGWLLVSRLVQCNAALHTVSSCELLTPSGSTYILDLARTLKDCKKRIEQLPQYSRWRAAAVESTEAHKVAWQHRSK